MSFPGYNLRRVGVGVRSCQSGASRETMVNARMGRPLQLRGVKSFFEDFFFSGGQNEKRAAPRLKSSLVASARLVGSQRTNLSPVCMKMSSCLITDDWVTGTPLSAPPPTVTPQFSILTAHLKKQNKTLKAGNVISSKWAFKIGGEWIYICYQRRLWLVSRRRCWICWSDVRSAGTMTFPSIALPTASEKQLVRQIIVRMSGYFPQKRQMEPSW